MLLKLYKEATAPKISEAPKPEKTLSETEHKNGTPKRKYVKRTFEGREDGGPVT